MVLPPPPIKQARPKKNEPAPMYPSPNEIHEAREVQEPMNIGEANDQERWPHMLDEQEEYEDVKNSKQSLRHYNCFDRIMGLTSFTAKGRSLCHHSDIGVFKSDGVLGGILHELAFAITKKSHTQPCLLGDSMNYVVGPIRSVKDDDDKDVDHLHPMQVLELLRHLGVRAEKANTIHKELKAKLLWAIRKVRRGGKHEHAEKAAENGGQHEQDEKAKGGKLELDKTNTENGEKDEQDEKATENGSSEDELNIVSLTGTYSIGCPNYNTMSLELPHMDWLPTELETMQTDKKYAIMEVVIPCSDDGCFFKYWHKNPVVVVKSDDGSPPSTVDATDSWLGKILHVRSGSMVVMPASLIRAGGYYASSDGCPTIHLTVVVGIGKGIQSEPKDLVPKERMYFTPTNMFTEATAPLFPKHIQIFPPMPKKDEFERNALVDNFTLHFWRSLCM
jgi:hypothetical protein